MKMQVLASMKKRHLFAVLLLLGAVAGTAATLVSLAGTRASTPSERIKSTPSQRANAVGKLNFVTPGLSITINSAQVSSNGTFTVIYTITDPSGFPLDMAGVTTPGPVSLSYIAAYIPSGQEQYVTYTTRPATGAVSGTVNQPSADSGGAVTATGTAGQYQYVFKTKAPAGFDQTATHTIGIYGSRDLTAFNDGSYYASSTANFVPNGTQVTVTRDVIRDQSCNACHYQLAFHGGSRVGIAMCVLCHTPQNVDPDTGNTLDMKVMAHKIHMGSQLPSVIGTATTPGVPYQIVGYRGAVSDFSTVIDPADPRRCTVCHSQKTGAAQATAYITKPTRAACGACHDNVNFATGDNHPGGFQWDDNECAYCHFPKGETPFDSSIMGAHVVPNDTPLTFPDNPDPLIGSVVVKITGITNSLAGQQPVVAFTIRDVNGNPVAMSALEDLSFTMAGPTRDYGYTSFGSDVTTPGYVNEDGTVATCDGSSNCTYTFQHAVPAGATGSYAIAVESERLENVLTNTNAAQQVESGTPNQIVYFSVDGSPLAPRRTVVQEANCNGCHVNLQGHGARRNTPEYCVLCHNPSNTDASQSAGKATAQGINMALLVHRIHDGVNVVPAGGQPYVVYGFGGNKHDFSGVLFPVMSPQGSATYLQNCAMCHVNGSEQTLPIGLNPVTDPQGWINPIQPTSSACSGCHVSKAESSHFLANTDSLGESCAVCHAAGEPYAVDSVHVK